MVTEDSYREMFYLQDDIFFYSQLNIFINYFSSFYVELIGLREKIIRHIANWNQASKLSSNQGFSDKDSCKENNSNKSRKLVNFLS
jgi:hypothetical protein